MRICIVETAYEAHPCARNVESYVLFVSEINDTHRVDFGRGLMFIWKNIFGELKARKTFTILNLIRMTLAVMGTNGLSASWGFHETHFILRNISIFY